MRPVSTLLGCQETPHIDLKFHNNSKVISQSCEYPAKVCRRKVFDRSHNVITVRYYWLHSQWLLCGFEWIAVLGPKELRFPYADFGGICFFVQTWFDLTQKSLCCNFSEPFYIFTGLVWTSFFLEWSKYYNLRRRCHFLTLHFL